MDTPQQHTPRHLAKNGLLWLVLAAATSTMAAFGAGHLLARNDENSVAAAFIGALPGVMTFVLAVGLVGFADISGDKLFAVLEAATVVLIVLAFVSAYPQIRGYAEHLGFSNGSDWGLPLMLYVVIVLSILDLRRTRRTS